MNSEIFYRIIETSPKRHQLIPISNTGRLMLPHTMPLGPIIKHCYLDYLEKTEDKLSAVIVIEIFKDAESMGVYTFEPYDRSN